MTVSTVMAELAELSYPCLMSTFHIHARMFRGVLAAPETNELQTAETDDRDAAIGQAVKLSRRGFAVWVYEHAHRPGRDVPQTDPYRVIAEWRAGGSRIR